MVVRNLTGMWQTGPVWPVGVADCTGTGGGDCEGLSGSRLTVRRREDQSPSIDRARRVRDSTSHVTPATFHGPPAERETFFGIFFEGKAAVVLWLGSQRRLVLHCLVLIVAGCPPQHSPAAVGLWNNVQLPRPGTWNWSLEKLFRLYVALHTLILKTSGFIRIVLPQTVTFLSARVTSVRSYLERSEN